MAEEAARDAAEALTVAEMMGIRTHGLNRVMDYAERLKAGGMDASARPALQNVAPALLRLDGANGLGPATARQAVRAAMEAAGVCGMAGVFVRRGTHLGALAPYLLELAEAGYAAIFTSNTAPMIAPPGARAALAGNMPLGLALPAPGHDPLLLDMALTVVSRSRIRAAASAGAPIPEGWALDAQGRATTDARAGLDGLIAAIGGTKGAALALALDLFSGVLSGARFLDDIPDTHKAPSASPGLGYVLIAVNAAALMPAEALSERMERARDKLAAAPPVDPTTPARLPGARALMALRSAREDGFAVDPATLARLRVLAGD